MTQVVSITNQGQITIPAALRRMLGLDQYRKASVRVEHSKIVIEPIPNLMDLSGLLKERALKGKTAVEIMQLEKKAIGKRVSQRHLSKNE